MATADLDKENVIAVTEADLRDEQRQAMERAMEEYKRLCLKSFSVNRSREVIQKQELPMPRQVTFDANPGKLQDMVDNAINRALINQSVCCPILFTMLWLELLKKDRHHHYMLAQPITCLGCHRLQLQRPLWPLRVQRLLLLQPHWG